MESYVYVNGWQEKIRFSSAHVIPEYEKCGRLHGHTYAIHAKLYGETNNKGIIIDFSIIKNELKKIVKDLDHKILIPKNSKYLKINIDNKNIIIQTLGKKYVFPKEDCVLLPIDSSSAEKLSYYIIKKFSKVIKKFDQINKIELGVDEGFGQGARVILDFKGKK